MQLSPDMDTLIAEALAHARSAGLDSLTASRRAVAALRRVRPDLTPDEAWSLVELSGVDLDSLRAA